MALSHTQSPQRLPFLARLSRRTRGTPAAPGSSPEAALSAINDELGKTLKAKVVSGLDGLRALAVILVLIEHFGLVHAPSGSMGVMIFFVLSGFLITAMLLREYRKSGTISFRNFYRRRAFRIFPSFYVCWILTTIVQSLAHQYLWKSSVVSFFYMMDYDRGLSPLNTLPYEHMWISWSLAVEEKFYLLWPLLLVWLLKKPATLIRNLGLIILGLWAYRAILYLGFHVHWMYCYCAFDMRADALFVGCLLAILVEKDRTRLIFCRLLRWQSLGLVPAVVLTLMVVFPPNNQAFYLFCWSIQPVVIAAWLLQIVYWAAKSWTICSSGIVRFTARISYALYLYHPLAGQIVYDLHMHHLGYPAAVLALLMAIASYYCVERPFMRMRDKGDRSHEASGSPALLGPDRALSSS